MPSMQRNGTAVVNDPRMSNVPDAERDLTMSADPLHVRPGRTHG